MEFNFPQNIPISENLRLRSFTPKDYISLWILIEKNRSYLEKWLPWVDTTTQPEHSLHFIMGTILCARKGKEVHWGIYEADLLIGLIGAHHLDWKDSHGMIGYWLDEDQQGKGIITSAVQALLPIFHQELGLKTVEIRASTLNKPSNQVAIRAGFSYIETLPKSDQVQDIWHDLNVYQHTIESKEESQ
ncbi:MAG: GNAT family N-acetyltransferase [Negativicutes bacterium]|nr:GNAT family N-acetyltransferase [Negativicutes bacterium]